MGGGTGRILSGCAHAAPCSLLAPPCHASFHEPLARHLSTAVAGAGVPLMAAGGGAGVVTVWNLEKRRLHTLIRDAHDGPLVSLHFFPGASAGPGSQMRTGLRKNGAGQEA